MHRKGAKTPSFREENQFCFIIFICVFFAPSRLCGNAFETEKGIT
jgi:hypothetical protein